MAQKCLLLKLSDIPVEWSLGNDCCWRLTFWETPTSWLDSEDDFCTGCQNISLHQLQFFSRNPIHLSSWSGLIKYFPPFSLPLPRPPFNFASTGCFLHSKLLTSILKVVREQSCLCYNICSFGCWKSCPWGVLKYGAGFDVNNESSNFFFHPQVVELNTFFLKHILWVPTSHWLNFYRLGIISLIVAPSLR